MRLRGLRPGELTSEQRAVYDGIVGGRRATGAGSALSLANDEGVLRGPFNAMLYSPPVGEALQRLGTAIRYDTELSDRAREIAILAVAAHEQSAFERSAHEAIGARVGLTDDEMAAIAAGIDPHLTDIDERSVLACVRAMVTGGDLTDDEYADAVAQLGQRVVVELSTLVGYYSLLALQLRLFRVG